MKDEIIVLLIRNLWFIVLKYYIFYMLVISKVCWVFDKFFFIFSKNSMFGYECVSLYVCVSLWDEWLLDGEFWGSC